MSQEEYTLFKGKAQYNPPETWVTYAWSEVLADGPETKNFPNDKVAQAYFSAIQETDYYKL